MAIKTNYFDGVTYSAADDIKPWRQFYTKGVIGRSAIGNPLDLLVQENNPASLSVKIRSGYAMINGFFIHSDNEVVVNIEANTSGYNRIDLIVLDISSAPGNILAVKGTPNSSPTVPLATLTQLALAQVAVGNNVSVINSINITDVRMFSQPSTFLNPEFSGLISTDGWIKFPTTANPSSDPNVLDDYREGTWTPTITSSAGVITTATAESTYLKIGRSVSLYGSVTLTDVGTGSGLLQLSLPFVSQSSSMGVCREIDNIGHMGSITILSGQSVASITKFDNTSFIVNGYTLVFNINYLTD